ncbi:bifunctional diguanylate cyclase/phosphodiesterase [Maridesulfovibrio sp.]|uniref:putative bifunctional diguanylate cyclase/phosphodiesterase n=1 Tax=Maridesulfovibrio sp. TaxID=2795000 RepID=UPI002A18AC9F|nr:bifunctional diguanylate cyclase/phosphodiesterase [Maridesulfovibrio sp.]
MHILKDPESSFFFACILSGLTILLFGISFYLRQLLSLRKLEPTLYKQTRKSFLVLIGLIGSFLAGYSAVIVGIAFHYEIDFNSIFGPILFLGSLFVLATAYLTLSMFKKLLKSRNALKNQAYHDYMTKLPNRRMLTNQLNAYLAQGKDTDLKFSVFFLDLLNFKKVNDSFGHHIGDRILIQFAERLTEAIGSEGLVCRLGGDDFIILQKDISPNESILRLRKLRKKILHPFEIDGLNFSLDISFGIYAYNNQKKITPDDILNRANIAMRRSKQRGNNVVSIFTKTMLNQTHDILKFENSFRTALQEDQFQLVFQPQFRIQEGIRLSGFEALVRWHHPERGMVSPAEFIPLAEETGLIVELDRLVMEKACSMWSECLKHSGGCKNLHISINLSAKHITESSMMRYIEETIKTYDIPLQSLYLELTESAFVNDPELAAARLKSLNKLGVHCAIDDFGTGYSSLAYLNNFPARSVKIDRSFIKGIEPGNDGTNLLESIIKLAHGLNMEAVAEGVETEQQLEILKGLNCDTVQGFYLGRPMPKEEALQLIANHKKINGPEE